MAAASATTLWTLHNRGTEAKRSDGVIRDPWAVTLSDGIDCLKAHPKAAVVALPEGRRAGPSVTLLEFG